MKRARTIYIDDELWGKVRDLAWGERVSVSGLLRGLISEKLIRVGGGVKAEGVISRDDEAVEKAVSKFKKPKEVTKPVSLPNKAEVISDIRGKIDGIDQGWRDRVRACPK